MAAVMFKIVEAKYSSGFRNMKFKRVLFFSCLALALISNRINAQRKKTDEKSLAGITFIERKSSLQNNAPLIILLHGYGSDEKDLFSFSNNIPPEFLVLSLRAPKQIHQTGYCWYDVNFSDSPPSFNEKQAEESMNKIVSFLSEAYKQYHFDNRKVFLLGFSQGAALSLSLSLQHPYLIKGAVILSGREMKSFIPNYKSKEELKNLNLFISHGTQDKVIPFSEGMKIDESLTKLNVKHQFKKYDMGHSISEQTYSDFVNWFTQELH